MSWKFNPFTLTLDYFEDGQSGPVDNAKRLIDTKTCAENISALKLVTAINDTEILLAEPDTFSNSKVLGIALQAGTTGQEIEVLLFGKVDDNTFMFTVNNPLYLKTNGTISDIEPSLPSENFNETIGYSLGSGSIFINIQEPIKL